jgi:3-(3-hydroxy-phenyl)propionate hydroxylase
MSARAVNQIWDVVIIGGGPVGVFAANLLGREGLTVRVIERDVAPYGLPRAVHIDHEMVRLFADAGLAEPLVPLMRAGDGHIHIGADRGVIRYLSAADQPRPFGHANDYFFYQPELEAILRTGLARFPKVRLDLGLAVERLERDCEGVTLALSNGPECRARWVIGCDGARSTTRRAMGVGLIDFVFDEPWLVVDAEVDGPMLFPPLSGVPEGANLQNLSCMMCDPARPTTIVPGRGRHRRWEFMLLPGEDETALSEPAGVAALIAPWVGEARHQIIRAATYRFHGLVAKDWRVGRVLLAGDAAHQTPPFFGQGLCHGLRDAAALAWRLALVKAGRAGEGLLDSYQTERCAQVHHVIGAAIAAGRYICELDPAKAAERDVRVRAQPGPRTAAELIAPLASAAIAPGAGERFINPAMAFGRSLDDITGGGWRLLTWGVSASPRTLHFLAGIGGREVDAAQLADTEGHLSRWFAAKGASFALIRPDFYLAAAAGDAADLDAQLTALSGGMALAAT